MQNVIVAITNSNVTPVKYDWPLARDRAEEINLYWRHRICAQPRLFNSAIFLLKDWSVENGEFSILITKRICGGASMDAQTAMFLISFALLHYTHSKIG
jgi:hypothetical protein